MIIQSRFFKAVLLSSCALLISVSTFSQKPEAEIEKFIRDFARANEEVTNTRDKETVLKYLSKDLFLTIVKSNVLDNLGLIQYTYDDYSAQLDQLLQREGMSRGYVVREILRSRLRGRTGVVVCDIDAQITSNGAVWTKGKQIVSFTLKKFETGWKILHINVIMLEEEENKGTCLVEVFAAPSGNYASKTVAPGGANYTTHLNTFDFTRTGGQVQISLDGEPAYSWQKDGPVQKAGQSLGTAVDEREAVMVILKDLYSKNCSEIRRK